MYLINGYYSGAYHKLYVISEMNQRNCENRGDGGPEWAFGYGNGSHDDGQEANVAGEIGEVGIDAEAIGALAIDEAEI